MALRQARDDHLPFLQLPIVTQRAGNAPQVGHTCELLDEIEVVRATHAHRLQVVRHACGAIDDAHALLDAVCARSLVDDVPDLGKPAGWKRSRPATGSSVAVRTRGDSPFSTELGVRVIFFFGFSGMGFVSLPASRTKPAFVEGCTLEVRDSEEHRREEPFGIADTPW